MHKTSSEQPKRKKRCFKKDEKIDMLVNNDFLRSKVNTMRWKY